MMLPFGARIFGFGRVVPIIGLWRRSRFENPVTACLAVALERLKKNCGHAERGFLSFGEALAKEHARMGL
jgi:hypothetical protein